MKVRCLSNRGIHLPKDMFFVGSTCTEESTFPLKIGKDYNVYAMTIHDGYAWYYIYNEYSFYYPVWNPCPLFEIVDGRISRYWVFSYKTAVDYFKAYALWIYPEWANDLDYYDNFKDENEKETTIFKAYREKMDLEFPDSSISQAAELIDSDWLFCPLCVDAWQYSDDKDALVKCPRCQQVLNNPHYKNEYPRLDQISEK